MSPEPRNPGVEIPDHHHTYYIDGADLHVVAQKKLFRVHGYFFSRESSVFNRKFDPKSPENGKKGKTDSDPIILDGVTPEEFEKFLWVFYNPKYSIYDASVDDWKDILNLADKWNFPEVKELVVRELQKKMDVDLIDKISLYQQYNVDPRHLVPLYAELCKRPASLTRQEAKILGLDATVLISATRQSLRASGGHLSPLSPLPLETKEDQIFTALESGLEIEEGSTKKFKEENPAYSLTSVIAPSPSSSTNHANGSTTTRGGSNRGGRGK